jgi:hypothetical protein
MELNIQIKNSEIINVSEMKLFIELYHVLIPIYFYYSNIYIYVHQNYILFNQQLFFNLNNVSIIDIKHNKNSFIYTNIDDFIKNINIDLNINKNLYLSLPLKTNTNLRNIMEENYYYNHDVIKSNSKIKFNIK